MAGGLRRRALHAFDSAAPWLRAFGVSFGPGLLPGLPRDCLPPGQGPAEALQLTGVGRWPLVLEEASIL